MLTDPSMAIRAPLPYLAVSTAGEELVLQVHTSLEFLSLGLPLPCGGRACINALGVTV